MTNADKVLNDGIYFLVAGILDLVIWNKQFPQVQQNPSEASNLPQSKAKAIWAEEMAQ